MRKINTIYLHCSATRPDQDISAADIKRWHVKGNRWSDIGYHAVIDLAGTLEHGRPIAKQGAGVKGQNANSVHVCYVGGLDSDGNPANTMNAAQIRQLHIYCAALVVTLGPLKLKGHNDAPGVIKACPAFDVTTEFPELVKWCQTPDETFPFMEQKQRQPEAVEPAQHCRRCNRRVRR